MFLQGSHTVDQCERAQRTCLGEMRLLGVLSFVAMSFWLQGALSEAAHHGPATVGTRLLPQ